MKKGNIIGQSLIQNKEGLNYLQFGIDEFTLQDDTTSNESSVLGVNMFDMRIPTGEPNRRYYAEYAVVDSDVDEIPELYVRAGSRKSAKHSIVGLQWLIHPTGTLTAP